MLRSPGTGSTGVVGFTIFRVADAEVAVAEAIKSRYQTVPLDRLTKHCLSLPRRPRDQSVSRAIYKKKEVPSADKDKCDGKERGERRYGVESCLFRDNLLLSPGYPSSPLEINRLQASRPAAIAIHARQYQC